MARVKTCNEDCFNCIKDDCDLDILTLKARKDIRQRDERRKIDSQREGIPFIKGRSNRKKLGLIFLTFTLIFNLTQVTNASELEPELIKGFATAYCQTGITASGAETREGICASSRDRLGKAIILYKRLPDGSVGDYIGTYECLDTGGNPGIKKGTVIDIWCDGLDACQDFMDLVYEDGCQGKVYIQVIDEVKG